MRLWIDGEPVTDVAHAIAATNRGLHYGDGLFETMLLSRGEVRLLHRHVARLQLGCERLGMRALDADVLAEDVRRVASESPEAIVKVIVVRGGAGRGYRPEPEAPAHRFVFSYERAAAVTNLRVRWCTSRWSSNRQLAGIKHLNRLEQVLAQAELGDYDEGLMMDMSDRVISATAGNLFVVRDGRLLTSQLGECGVCGVMRAEVLELAAASAIETSETYMTPTDIERAEEIFITNAVRGIRPVVSVEDRSFPIGPITTLLIERLRFN